MVKRMATLLLAVGILINLLNTPVFASDTSVAESALTETQPIFKSFYWGDTKETVIASEGTPDSEGVIDNLSSEYIVYNTTVAGLDAMLGYYFCDRGLYTIRYVLAEEHTTESLYIDDVEKLQAGVTQKYGEPLLDFDKWESDSEKEYYKGREGTALLYGYLSKNIYWMLDDEEVTTIYLKCSADNYTVATTLTYQSGERYPEENNYSSDF